MPLSAPPCSSCHVYGWSHRVRPGSDAEPTLRCLGTQCAPPWRYTGCESQGRAGGEVPSYAFNAYGFCPLSPPQVKLELWELSPVCEKRAGSSRACCLSQSWRVPAALGPLPRALSIPLLSPGSPAVGRSVATATSTSESPASLLLSTKWQLLSQVGARQGSRPGRGQQGNPFPPGLPSLAEQDPGFLCPQPRVNCSLVANGSPSCSCWRASGPNTSWLMYISLATGCSAGGAEEQVGAPQNEGYTPVLPLCPTPPLYPG